MFTKYGLLSVSSSKEPKVFSGVQSNTHRGLRSIFKCTLNWNSFFSRTVSWYILDAREVRAQYENAGPLLEKGSARSKADGDHSHIKRTVVEMTGKASSIHEVSHLYEKNQYPRALRSLFFCCCGKKRGEIHCFFSRLLDDRLI